MINRLKNRHFCFIAVSLMISAFAAQAQCEVLLNCNTSGGPDQQVTVVQENGQLTLKELTTSGNWQERVLSPIEWSNQKINLRSGSFGEKAVLAKTADGWYFQSQSLGVSESGFADCW